MGPEKLKKNKAPLNTFFCLLFVEMDEMELHGVGLAVDGVLGAAVRVPAPVHVELGELELAGESAARDPGRVVSLGLEEGLGAVTVVLHLDHPRV